MQGFMADSQCLAISHGFDEFLNQASEAIQKKLLAEDKLTLTRAVKLARGKEVAAVKSKE